MPSVCSGFSEDEQDGHGEAPCIIGSQALNSVYDDVENLEYKVTGSSSVPSDPAFGDAVFEKVLEWVDVAAARSGLTAT